MIRKHIGPIGLGLDVEESLGFTGTQKGMTPAQKGVVADLLVEFDPVEVHHGDCIGADEEFHDIVLEFSNRVKVVIHPPLDSSKRAYCKGDEARSRKEYLRRNRDIVAESDVLIAVPKQMRELKGRSGGGTWATVRYARQAEIPVYIVFPDGAVDDD